MSNIIPAARPKLSRKEALKLIKEAYPDFKLPDFFILGIRGYYLDTMGEAGKNDRNIYDDAIFLIGKEDCIAFNGNTDPAAFRKAIAVLKPGIWPAYQFALHKSQYMALCQRGASVTVVRDGTGTDTGMFGINIHRGGNWGTSSLGCQTIPPPQWDEFITTAMGMAKKYYDKAYRSKSDYTYVLLEYKKPEPAIE